ncbi:MAG: TlpA family protein disulfide reductase [Chitinophagaceae bacterium]|nr:TlpA family protein disulfide reductase [Chitinophagaceae bacterium]
MKKYFILMLTAFFATSFSARTQNIPSWKVEDLQQFMAGNDSILVINFWATFCKPCVEEMPYVQSISAKYKDKKVTLLLVSLDMKETFPDKIRTFANGRNFSAPIVWLNETNADYFCPRVDKAWDGAIPSTLFLNKKTGYKNFIDHQMKPEEFEMELKKALN